MTFFLFLPLETPPEQGSNDTSEDKTVDTPPSTKFWKKEGGYLEENFFIWDFLYKTFSENSIRKKEGEGGRRSLVSNFGLTKKFQQALVEIFSLVQNWKLKIFDPPPLLFSGSNSQKMFYKGNPK